MDVDNVDEGSDSSRVSETKEMDVDTVDEGSDSSHVSETKVMDVDTVVEGSDPSRVSETKKIDVDTVDEDSDRNQVMYIRELQYPCFDVRPTENFEEEHPNWCLFSLDEPSEGKKSFVKGPKPELVSRYEIKKPLSSSTQVSYPVIVPFRPSILPNNPINVRQQEMGGTDWNVIPFTLFRKDFPKVKFHLHNFPNESEEYSDELVHIFGKPFQRDAKEDQTHSAETERKEEPEKNPVFGESLQQDGEFLQDEFEWVKCWDERIRLGLELSIYSFKMAKERASCLTYIEYDMLRTNFRNELRDWDTLAMKIQCHFEICLEVYKPHHAKITAQLQLPLQNEAKRLEVELNNSFAECTYLMENKSKKETDKLCKFISKKFRWEKVLEVLRERILSLGAMWNHFFNIFTEKLELQFLPEIPEKESEKIPALVRDFHSELSEKFNILITNLHDGAYSIMKNFEEYMKPGNLDCADISKRLSESESGIDALQHLIFEDIESLSES